MSVEIPEKQRKALREFGKLAYKNMLRKVGGKKALAEIARKQGHHGKAGGRPKKYPQCKIGAVVNPRHRFWNGRCSLCGIPQDTQSKRK
jgi:hypothetical protein